jgi:predicted ArsR family transcriptional regulator
VEPVRGAADLADLTPLNALAHSVRRRLYEFVAAASRAVGRDGAAAAVGVSRSLAAYHLDKLVEHGLLEAGYSRQGEPGGPGAGRPPKLYRRARRDFALGVPPRDYRLLGDLLVRAVREDHSGVVRRTLERVAHKHGRSVGADAMRTARDDRTTLPDVLRLHGYEPFESESGTIRLRNCPFEAFACQDPELVCGLNLRLLEGLIDGLQIDARAALQPQEGQCCVAITTRNGL